MEQMKENKKIGKLLESIKQREQKLNHLLQQQKRREIEIQTKLASNFGGDSDGHPNFDIEL